MNSWNKWLGKNWKTVEPRMKAALKARFKQPLYTDEFDDIIQQFVTYLLTRDDSPYEDKSDESTSYLVCQWVVRRGIAMRTKEDRYEALPDDFDMEDPCEESLGEEENVKQRIALCEKVLQKRCSHPLTMDVWKLYRKGISEITIAKRLMMSYPAVTSIVRNIKGILRAEFPNEVFRVYGGRSLRKAA